ncbi:MULTISPECIES: ATP phosphoribosyltransferase regulatory subunit, partial [Bacillus]|uniref:ATP phosphoribosyltransferase regulatory subunit n=1 Tax=Bacillus TaxID=1386 RepID=UPI001BB39742
SIFLVAVNELQQLQQYLIALGINENAIFNPFLARGLTMYTGTVYEIFLKDGSITSSIGSCGRYDNIIGEEELSTETAMLRNMKEGIEVKVPLSSLKGDTLNNYFNTSTTL